MKKRMIILCMAVFLLGTAVIGGTFAGFNTETKQQATAQITTKRLGVRLLDSTIDTQEIPLASDFVSLKKDGVVMPGDVIPLSRCVANDADYDLYARATIYKHWGNEALDGSKIKLVTPDTENWIVWYEDEEQVIMYYRRPLTAMAENGEMDTSEEMLSGVLVSEDVDNAYAGENIILEFEIDAVQRLSAEAAFAAEWGVYPTFDEAGNIVKISE